MSGEMSQWVWDTMLSMTILMALVLLLRKPVSHFFGPNIAYLLWILPVARLFMPTLTLEAPAPVENVSTFISSPVGAELLTSGSTAAASSSALASLDWMLIGLILWLGCAGLLFISKLASYMQFREDIVADGRLVGRHGNIKILETAAVGGPLAFGVIEKYIAVPTNFFRDYAPRERELALEHEIAHHESGDLAANFIGLIILSLHWFNPVAWFAWIAFRQDQETACDARVLAQSGHDVRAVYGRTIAKSVSGHRLGLASPLNQKDKIKGRLKMLGQAEKSSFRRRLGSGLVAIGAFMALPLTATVTYAEQLDPVDLAVPLAPVAPIAPAVPVAPSSVNLPEAPAAAIAPTAPVAPWAEGDEVHITMLHGSKDFKKDKKYVHRIKHNGRTVVLRTNKKLSKADIREMVAEAEESRLEADAELREHELEMAEHQREMKEEQREIEMEMRELEQEKAEARREAQWEMRESQREAERSVREAEREARSAIREAKREARSALREAQREAKAAAREAQREAKAAAREAQLDIKPAAIMSTISYSTSNKINGPDCIAMNKKIAMNGRSDLSGQAWAAVAGCGGFEVKIDKVALLKVALEGLKKGRAEAVKCNDSKADRAKKIREFDRSIAKVKKQLSMT